MKIDKPGAYELSAKEYHADPCVEPSLSSSIAKVLMEESALSAWWLHPRMNPDWTYEEKHDERTALGTACHLLVLRKGDALEVGDESWDSWRKKEAQAFRDDALAAGRTPCLAKTYEKAQAMADAAHAQMPSLGDPEKGKAEVSFFGEDHAGGWVRCRTDWFEHESATIYDYKTTISSANPIRVGRTIAQMKYYFQAAFYERVVGNVLPDLAGRIRFSWIFQELKPPYLLSRVALMEHNMEVARREVGMALNLWTECKLAKRWHGYPQHIVPVELPAFAHFDFLAREEAEGNDDAS